jgi:uncharacterized protein (TIGR03437 family)
LIRKSFLYLSQFACLAALCQGQVTYTISTYAGTAGIRGFAGDGGAATAAQLAGPAGLAIDSSGTLYIVDAFNQRVRTVAAGGNITTIAGNGTGGYSGDGKGATSAELLSPFGIAVDGSGNVYIADSANQVIRKVAGGNINTFAGNQALGGGFTGDGTTAVGAQLDGPTAVALDPSGNLYISDTANNRIRQVVSGNINTYAGFGPGGFQGDGGPALNATLDTPRGICFDSAGNLYIADSNNHRIRKVTPGGIMTTIAGTGTQGFSGDNGLAVLAKLNRPLDVVVDSAGNIFFSDFNNGRVRRIAANGIITTVAGDGLFGFTGDGGPATSATLNFPTGLAVDSSGRVYISDSQNNVVRLLTPAASNPGRPSISAGGVISASSYGAFTSIAPGGWIEIYGSNLAAHSRTWAASDFTGNNAPTSLDGTTVTIGGQNAFVEFISSGQVNAQVPSGISTGSQKVVVATGAGASTALSINVNSTEPGVFAPPQFKIGGIQYAGALFPDGKTYVLPVGAISGITSRPAKPGDTITLYGVAFGPVSPDSPAGMIVSGNNTLVTPVAITIGGLTASLGYQGLAPDAVGLYQFNVVVPNVAAGAAVPLTVTVGGTAIPQSLNIAVGN